MAQKLTIGTRGSRLALAQAAQTRAALMTAHGLDESDIAIRIITTSGDLIQDRSLIEAGGKGLFTKEIEEALLSGAIDIAVHSAKDMPAHLPDGLMLSACLPREDARDCLIGAALDTLPDGARLGTSSPRRAAMMKRLRPDLKIVDFRGNVDTRIAKIERGDVAASLLAMAGLKRIGMTDAIAQALEIESFLPAVGQGAIVLETRSKDSATRKLLDVIDHPATFTALKCERAFLNILDGSCRTPIAGHATIKDGALHFHCMILKPDGTECFETRRNGTLDDAEQIGLDAGSELIDRAPENFFEAA